MVDHTAHGQGLPEDTDRTLSGNHTVKTMRIRKVQTCACGELLT